MSAVSVWEIVVKAALGRLRLRDRPDRFIPEQLEGAGFAPLPILVGHTLAVWELPAIHRDPFDRLLVAQARSEGLMLVSADSVIGKYPVEVLW